LTDITHGKTVSAFHNGMGHPQYTIKKLANCGSMTTPHDGTHYNNSIFILLTALRGNSQRHTLTDNGSRITDHGSRITDHGSTHLSPYASIYFQKTNLPKKNQKCKLVPDHFTFGDQPVIRYLLSVICYPLSVSPIVFGPKCFSPPITPCNLHFTA
jgi:hypothetical protein